MHVLDFYAASSVDYDLLLRFRKNMSSIGAFCFIIMALQKMIRLAYMRCVFGKIMTI